MRIPSHHSVRLARALVVTSSFALAACAGGSGSSTLPNPGSNALCDAGAPAIVLARPGQGQSGVSTSTNTIEIVVNGNGDQLGNPSFTSMFDLNLRDNFGNQLVTGPLSAVPDPNGPHPFPNTDFFYAGTLQGTLQPGQTYTVFLNAPNTNCTPGQVGSFFT